MHNRTIFRSVSILLVALAVAVGVNVTRQALASDDGGPPLGALCAGLPAIVFLIGAALVWNLGESTKT